MKTITWTDFNFETAKCVIACDNAKMKEADAPYIERRLYQSDDGQYLLYTFSSPDFSFWKPSYEYAREVSNLDIVKWIDACKWITKQKRSELLTKLWIPKDAFFTLISNS